MFLFAFIHARMYVCKHVCAPHIYKRSLAYYSLICLLSKRMIKTIEIHLTVNKCLSLLLYSFLYIFKILIFYQKDASFHFLSWTILTILFRIMHIALVLERKSNDLIIPSELLGTCKAMFSFLWCMN